MMGYIFTYALQELASWETTLVQFNLNTLRGGAFRCFNDCCGFEQLHRNIQQQKESSMIIKTFQSAGELKWELKKYILIY